MAVNKVVFGDRVIMDISDSDINASMLPEGRIAYAGNGERIIGTGSGSTNVYLDTTENWNSKITYVPNAGDIIVYTDKDTIVEDETITYVPGIKIGDGNAYLIDIAFVTDALSKKLMEHINNVQIHVSNEDRERWNNKLNLDIDGEALVFNRL